MRSAARTAGILAGMLIAWGAAGRIDYEAEMIAAKDREARESRSLTEWCDNLKRARARNARIPEDPKCNRR